MSAARAVVIALLGALLAGCVGVTVGSGVGDRMLGAPPYATGSGRVHGLTVGHLPIRFDRRLEFEPSELPGTPLARLMAEMNGALGPISGAIRLGGEPLPGIAPDVSFGCRVDPIGECLPLADPGDRHARQLELKIGRPSPTWVTALRVRAAEAGVTAVLQVSVEIGQYWVRQRNLLGAKEVVLGTGHAVPVPWLTSLEAPVQVVQLTGAILDTDGRAIAIAAEGMLARRTGIVLSGFGAQELISDAEIEDLLVRRRDDLPGQPLVWEAALESLLRNLGPGMVVGGSR